ncbi:MAG: hypothetical protein AB7U83_20020 [Vicinamibacterales bacterium]
MLLTAVGLVAALAVGGVIDTPSTSADSAARLTALLTAAGLDAAAAEDPDEPGRFIAALALPGQLLVMTARCSGGTEALRARLASRAYRDVYTDLHACADAASKFFVHDMGADGLHANLGRDRVPDIVYEMAAHQILLDGDWRAHELKRDAYEALCGKLDARYDRMLRLLAAGIQPPTVVTAGAPPRSPWR